MPKKQEEYEVEAIIGKRRKKNSGMYLFLIFRCSLISRPVEKLSQVASHMGAFVKSLKRTIHDR